MMARAVPSLMLCLLAGPGLADGRFRPPQGCALDMTVQHRGCKVVQHFRCEADNPGDRRSATFTREGRSYDSRIDAETRWMESVDAQGVVETLLPGAVDDASFTTLIGSGHDSFDFWTILNDGQKTRFTGFDTLTGETVTIDGISLERTRFDLTGTDIQGNVLFRHHGNQYISRDFRRFFAGQEVFDNGVDPAERLDHSPTRFDFPGEPGFGSTTPEYDCDMLMAQHSDRKATL